MGLKRRLGKLEARVEDRRDWPIEDQVKHIILVWQMHTISQTIYPATDRELNVCGVIAALLQLGGPGPWTAPHSRTTIELLEDDTFRCSGQIVVEDLPEVMRERIGRMDPTKQPERDESLYTLWRQRKIDEKGE